MLCVLESLSVSRSWRDAAWVGAASSARYGDDDDDDDDDAALYPRPLKISLANPAPAPALQELEQRGVLWHPDFVGLSLGAYFRRSGLTAVRASEYLLDDVYRPDPRAFVASTTLLLYELNA